MDKADEMKVAADIKDWYALSCPVAGLRFDARTLAFMDLDHDGFIRTDEVLAAVEFLKKGEEAGGLSAAKSPGDRLAEVMAQLAELDKREPSAEDRAALAAWEAEGKKPEIAVCGEGTAAAEAALAKVEPVIDGFFTPAEDLPLVTDEPDVALPLKDHLNPRHLEAVLALAELCVKPILGERETLTRLDWKHLKAAFAPYRAWLAAKPVANAGAREKLEGEEKLLRYKLHLGEFLSNYVTMDRLYSGHTTIFQTGVLRIDGRELSLCFHVASEAAHSALAGKSSCCVIYLKLTRPETGDERSLGAVVTAGGLSGLYVGRNGVFYDHDGGIWQAVVTKMVENPVSLAEAFWTPWRKLGETATEMLKKFLGERQEKSMASVSKGTASAQAGGAAMASAVAAIGIGLGMLGTAAAAIMAAVSTMTPVRLLLSVIAVILIVSLPSVALAYFKLRRRDLGAVLNASGWAINRRMRVSMKRARQFTVCRRGSGAVWFAVVLVALLALSAFGWWRCRGKCACSASSANGISVTTNEVQNAQN